MIRAGVFIGVDQTGKLQKLNDAANGAQRMYDWAWKEQKIPKKNLKLITDKKGKEVTINAIYKAINALINGAGVDQLIIYFAGHGIYNNYSERWLLSNAPEQAHEAINVLGSVEQARYCGVKHIVFISDACRMATDSIQASNVNGSGIFPNEPIGISNPVDQFFACSRGRAAIEFKDPNVAANQYTALYTTVLLDLLKGDHLELLDYEDNSYFIKPPKLDKFIKSELPRWVKKLALQYTVNQEPDAILSYGGSWIARLDNANFGSLEELSFQFDNIPPLQPQITPNDLIQTAINETAPIVNEKLIQVKAAINPQINVFVDDVEHLQYPFGPDHFETQCGFKVQGATFTEFFTTNLHGELLGDEIIRFYPTDFKGAYNVLLRFNSDFGTVIPAIPGYIAALTFENNELINVAYEPSTNTPLWEYYQQELESIRTLRAIAAASAKHSRFAIDRNDAQTIAQRMQYEKLIDPTLSIYAAYAYHDLQEIDRISRMGSYQSDSLRFQFFDLALLSRQLVNKAISASDKTIFPFTPLLAQGWSLIRSNRITLPPALDGLEDNLLNSLWSLYNLAGLEKIKQAMQQ